MNPLLTGLPTQLDVAGETVEIDADYRTALLILTAYEDRSLTPAEQHAVLVARLYRRLPADYKSAIQAGIAFLNFADRDTRDNESEPRELPRLYSWKYDGKYVFAAVNKALNGRLCTGGFVHWWEFLMGFMEIGSDCMLSRMIYLRKQFAEGQLTKEERRQYAELRDILEYPEELTDEEQVAADVFLARMKGG